MDHSGALRLMAEAVEGRLSQDDERELALHLVGCVECKTLYDGLQKAHPALAAIAAPHPASQAVDRAVLRATTILRGEADPGPVGGAPPPTEPARAAPWPLQPTGPLLPDDAVETPDEAEEPVAETFDEASIVETPTEPRPPAEPPRPAPPPGPGEPEPAPAGEPERSTAPIVIPPPAPPRPTPPPTPRPAQPPSPVPPPPPLPPELPAVPPATPRPPLPIATPTVRTVPPPAPPPTIPPRATGPPGVRTAGPVDEVEELFEEDHAAAELRARQPTTPRPAVGPGPWLAAIAVTIALAVLAGVLITRGQGLIGGGDLPSASEVRSRVERIFTDMKSLKATFSIRRLGLYRTSGSQSSLVYSFADGRYDGRIVYDRSEGYRQEVTLDVRDQEVTRAKIVQTADETRSLIGSGSAADLLVERRPPFGPPDGELRPTLGLLEDALGTVVREIVDATDLEVVRKTTQGERELYEVTTAVGPDELTRADQLDVFLDTRTFFPVIVRRTISRNDARVLGPSQVLGDDAIAKAFGDRERVTTEVVEIDNLILDDIVLPGDFVLDTPQEFETQTSDSSFERVTHADVASKLKFKPLFPRTLPGAFKEDGLAVYTGTPRGWGPGGNFPPPDSIMHASYFDGKTTVVVTERQIPSGPFNLTQSPLQRNGLPITVRPFVRAEKRFFYGVSPEVPPHAYGFLGNVFAMVVGYAPAEELLDILSSLTEAPADVPASALAPSPGATVSPTISPGPASPSPTAPPSATPIS